MSWRRSRISCGERRLTCSWATSRSPTCPPGAPGLVDTCVQVNVFRNQARANPLPTVFARLAGPIDQGVQATATAQVLYGTGPGPGDCVKPFAIPDRWGEYRNDEAVTTPWVDDIPQDWPIDEAYSLVPTEHPWDPNDEYNVRYLNGPNRGEYLNDPVVDPATAGDPIDRYPRLLPAPPGYHIPANPQLEIPGERQRHHSDAEARERDPDLVELVLSVRPAELVWHRRRVLPGQYRRLRHR